jgi:hypothetical protein
MKTLNEQIREIQKTAVDVIKNPAGFFKTMPVSGGFADPLIFLAAMGIISGVIQAILSLVGLGVAVSFLMALGAVIIMPLIIAVVSFISAGIFFVIWKLMGSTQSYEAAYRCVAYASAIMPIMVLIGVIPYLGAIIGLLWMLYLMVIASEKVHRLASQKAWIVFGVIFALLILLNINAQRTARNTQRQVEEINRQIKNMENMTPEEAGKAMGEFLKGFNEAAGKKE